MRDIVIASSRGEGLEELIRQGHPSPQNVEVIYQSSATLSIIKSMALNLIRKSPTDDIHMYIIGGYCNLTQVISSTRHSYGRTFKYQEVVFWEDPETAVPRVTNAIHDTFNELNKTHQGCQKIFSVWELQHRTKRKTLFRSLILHRIIQENALSASHRRSRRS